MRNKTVLIFGYSTWDIWRQDHDIALCLSKQNTVVYCEKQFGKHEQKKNPGRKHSEWISENLCIIPVPARLPRGFSSFSFLRSITAACSYHISKFFLARHIKKILKELGLTPSLIFCFEPFDILAAKRFKNCITCWRVFDEVSLFVGNRSFKKVVEAIEKKCAALADYIFTSSKSQYNKRKALNTSTYFIPNAANVDLYSMVLTQKFPIPEDMFKIPHPILGFIGTIDQRIDIELIQKITQVHPEWSVLFIGPEKMSMKKRLQEIPGSSIYVLDSKPVKLLPAYLQPCDVSLIPYLINEQTSTMFPIKVYEHLGAGKNIVATALPELQPLSKVIRLAKNHEAFIEAISQSLVPPDSTAIKQYTSLAAANCWKSRLEEITTIIEQGASR